MRRSSITVSTITFFFSACLLLAEGQSWLQTGEWTLVRLADAWQCLGYAMPSDALALAFFAQPLTLIGLAISLVALAASQTGRYISPTQTRWKPASA